MDTIPEDLNLRYLSIEISQIDLLVKRALDAALQTGQEANDRFRGLYISPQEAQALSQAPVVAKGLDNSSAAAFIENAQAACRQIEVQAQSRNVKLRLPLLREYFGLSDFEYHAFLICLLPTLDLRYERIFGYLQNDVTKKQAGVNLILDLLVEDRPEFNRLTWLGVFSARGTLVKYHLLRPVNPGTDWQEPRLSQLFEVSPALISWLVGQYFPEKNWLHLELWDQLDRAISASPYAQDFSLDWQRIFEKRPFLSFVGPDLDRQLLAAKKVAQRFNMPLLQVDLNEVCAESPFTLATLRLLIRDACLLDAILYIRGWDRVLDADGFIPDEILEEMAVFAGIFILGTPTPWRISRKGSRLVYRVQFELPSSLERARLWEQALAGQSIPAETLRDIAGQFVLTSGQIENAVFTVQNAAFQSGEPFSREDLFFAARQQSAHHLNELAQKIEPRYTWDDIILPDEELHTLSDIISMMRYRALVLEQWGLGKKLTSSAGISALFSGDPGTGKTLAAQIIANELQLDLYRINLSNVVSKYIGETEKNLEKIFEEAQNSNAVLFFDEADAIFGKRSEVKDAHDRYANIEVGYLLQRMETYGGVTILATNLRANMDEAFTRRINFIVNFPLPDETQRAKIWNVLLPESLPVAADIDWEFLARKYTLAGGNIRNILVSAAFLAAQSGGVMGMDHLLRACRQEMLKMGRFIKEEDYLYPNGQRQGQE